MKNKLPLLSCLTALAVTAHLMAAGPVSLRPEALKALSHQPEKSQAMPIPQRVALADGEEPAGPEFAEGFEGWDMVTSNWIPAGWTEQNTDAVKDLHDGVYTWHVNSKMMAPNVPLDAFEGYNTAIIFNAAYSEGEGEEQVKVELPQDEWLITPSIPVDGNEIFSYQLSYRPVYLFNLNNEYFKIDENDQMVFVKKEPSTTLKTYVREEGGEWIQLHDIYDEWKDDYTLQELWTEHQNAEYRYYEFSLKDYAGKTVQFAFRFVGQWGNTMQIDDVKVELASTKASYIRPQGALFYGLSSDYKSVNNEQNQGVMMVPPYTDLTWTNTSAPVAETFEWTYSDPADPANTTTSADRDLTVSYPASDEWYRMPVLRASSAYAATTEYAGGYALQAGGKAVRTVDGQEVTYGVSSYDLSKGYFQLNMNQTPIVGWWQMPNGMNTDVLWRQIIPGYKTVHLYALSNDVDKPLQPYVLSSVRIHADVIAEPDARFSVAVFRTNAMGSAQDIIAVGECLGKDIIQTQLAENIYGSTLPFKLKKYTPGPDAETPGTTSDEPIVVSDRLLIYFTGFDDPEKVSWFVAYQTQEPNANEECNAVLYFRLNSGAEGEEDREIATSMNFMEFNGEACNNSFLFTLDAEFPYLRHDGEETMEMPVAGATQTVAFTSYYDAADLTVTSSDASWLTAEMKADKQLAITAKPLEGDYREGEITVTAPAVSALFKVTQGEKPNGLASLEAELSVSVADGTLVIDNGRDDVSAVSVYTLSGKCCLSAVLTAGCNRIAADGLSDGVYLLRFNDGTTLKVIK